MRKSNNMKVFLMKLKRKNDLLNDDTIFHLVDYFITEN